jgi:hypothetical protein
MKIKVNPGMYELGGNQCTSVVYNALIASGIKINNIHQISTHPLGGGDSGINISPNRLNYILKNYNQDIIKEIFRYNEENNIKCIFGGYIFILLLQD